MRLSNLIYIPLVLSAIVLGYFTYEISDEYAKFMAIPIILCAGVYFISPQIDWWWFQRNPLQLDGPVRKLMEVHFPYYSDLDSGQKKRFESRMAMYLEANSWSVPGQDGELEPPEDAKAFIAANIVQLTFGQEDYRLSKFERIIFYPGSFHSPQYPKYIHASEIFEEDGVLIFSIGHLIKRIQQPAQHFNLPFYEYAKIYRLLYPNKAYPSLDDSHWPKLKGIGGAGVQEISDYIGLPTTEIDINAVSIYYFFYFSEKFKGESPAIFETYQKIFNQNPLNNGNPIVEMGDLKEVI